MKTEAKLNVEEFLASLTGRVEDYAISIKEKLMEIAHGNFEDSQFLTSILHQSIEDCFFNIRHSQEEDDILVLNKLYDCFSHPNHFVKYYETMADHFINHEESKYAASCLMAAQRFEFSAYREVAIYTLIEMSGMDFGTETDQHVSRLIHQMEDVKVGLDTKHEALFNRMIKEYKAMNREDGYEDFIETTMKIAQSFDEDVECPTMVS